MTLDGVKRGRCRLNLLKRRGKSKDFEGLHETRITDMSLYREGFIAEAFIARRLPACFPLSFQA